MANEEQVAILKRGVNEWNKWCVHNLRTYLERADLSGANLSGADLIHAQLRNAKLQGVKLKGARLCGAALHGAILDHADLTGADLTGADLSGATLRHADLPGADLRGATLTGATLRNANLREADLIEAILTDANLINAHLNGADLRGANLKDADVELGYLNDAKMGGYFEDINLRGADLTGADLNMATLRGANLCEADLTGACLINVDLRRANLTGATLLESDLTGAVFEMTVFGAVALHHTKGLGSCNHLGPSVIDHITLDLSGQLPLAFLRGCGLPDRLIDYLPSLFHATPIQFYSCFISYSTVNQDFAERLHADLQNNGVRCWFAPHDIQGGKKIHEQIDEAIRAYDRLLVILSSASMSSTWVQTEIANARKKEAAQKRRVLFPISIVPYEAVRSWELFDADLGKDSAKEIREYFIPDFSAWKDHDKYTKAFDSLLKALKSADAAAT